MEISGDLLSIEQSERRVVALKKDLAELSKRLEDCLGAVRCARRPRTTCRRTATSTSSSERSRNSRASCLELSLLQARARLDAITFETVDLTPEQGYCIASQHRRDWMNARAALVDSWRLITFNANDLQSDLDLVFSGDLGNVGDNPIDFRGTNGRLRVGLRVRRAAHAAGRAKRLSAVAHRISTGSPRLLPIPRRRPPRHPQHAAADARRPIELRAAAGGRPRGDHASRPGPAAAFGAGPARGSDRPGHAARRRAASRNSATPWPATWSRR